MNDEMKKYLIIAYFFFLGWILCSMYKSSKRQKELSEEIKERRLNQLDKEIFELNQKVFPEQFGPSIHYVTFKDIKKSGVEHA